MNQIMKREPGSVVNWEDEKEMRFLRSEFGENLTDPEWQLFVSTAQMTGANPVLSDIYAIKYKGERARMAIVFDHKFLIRRVNEVYGDFQGFTLPEYWDGKRWIPVWDTEITSVNHLEKAPKACKIGVKRKGYAEPAYSQVLWRERAKIYNGKLQAKWATDPIGMITKCTKVQSLRDNYGSIIGSMLIREEVDEPEDVEGMRQTPSGDWYDPDDTKQTPKERVENMHSLRNGNLDPGTEKIKPDKRKTIRRLCHGLGYVKAVDYIPFINTILDDHGLPEIPEGKDTKALTVASGEVVLAALWKQMPDEKKETVTDADLEPEKDETGLFKGEEPE